MGGGRVEASGAVVVAVVVVVVAGGAVVGVAVVAVAVVAVGVRVVAGAALAVAGRVVVGVAGAGSTCTSSTDLAGTEGPGSTAPHSGTGGRPTSLALLLQPAATITRAAIAATAVRRAPAPRSGDPKHMKFMAEDLSVSFSYLQPFYDISMFTRVDVVLSALPNTPAPLVGRTRVVASAR